MPTIQETLQHAVSLQNQGKSQEAASYYEAILQVIPDQPDALHLLGLIASSQQDYPRAEQLIRRALAIVPESSVFHGNLGVVLRMAGRIDEAIDAYRMAIELDPRSADAHFNLGKSLKLKGDVEASELEFRRSVELDPSKHTAWLSLMNVQAERKNIAAAITIGQDAMRYCPRSSPLRMNMGALAKRLGRIEDAIRFYREAVELAPSNVEALCRLANTLIDRHAISEGQELLTRAHRLEPRGVHTLVTTGMLQNAIGNAEAAVQIFRQVVALYPEHSTAYVHLATALRKQGELSDALELLDVAAEFETISAEAIANKAGILMCLGRHSEAESCFLQAIDARENFRDSHSNLLMCQQYSPGYTPDDILRNHCEWNDMYAAGLANSNAAKRRFSILSEPNRKLRIGFVSGDLGMHPVGYFTVRMFESLNSADVSTFVYSDRPGRDPIAARIESSVTEWNDVAALSDDTLSERIRRDEIDILFDLAGHTASNRLMVFAQRSAPVQITWAGYVGTTGVAEMDFLLADRFHVPSGCEGLYRERILRMPNGYVTFEPPPDAPDVNELPALAHGILTFAAMCNPAKVNGEVIAVWSSILEQIPNSRLLLCYCGWPDKANQRRVLEGLGSAVTADRVLFQQHNSSVQVLETYRCVDLALDTFPYSGGLTTCEAMWMGVPTITFPGERFSSRHSFSHLSNVGLHECIAKDKTEYISRVLVFAGDLERLQSLRSTLRRRVQESPLGDGPRFAQDFTRLMHEAWRVARREPKFLSTSGVVA